MKHTVKLAEADVINKNNRCYSKEALERINKQLNSKSVNVYDQTARNKLNPPLNSFVGQTVKCSSRIENNTLFVDVDLKKPASANFINLCCLGYVKLSTKLKKNCDGNISRGLYNLSHEEIEEPNVQHLFADNTNSYYDESNIISQNKMEIE